MNYQAPDTIESALAALAGDREDSAILAGGTDLLVQLRSGQRRPGTIVDIKNIRRLRSISIDEQSIRVGAAVSGAELNEHEAFKREWPGVAEAFDLIGSTQIQGRATLGGNLCNASPAADSVPALIAAGAECVIAGPEGLREVPVESIVSAPGKTTLAKDEILVEFRLGRRGHRAGDAYQRFIPRSEMDIAVVGVAVNLQLDERGVCQSARVGLGAVAPTPLLVSAAAEALAGSTLDSAALDAAVLAVRQACQPVNDKRGTIDYRIEVAGVLLRRVALLAQQRAGEQQ